VQLRQTQREAEQYPGLAGLALGERQLALLEARKEGLWLHLSPTEPTP